MQPGAPLDGQPPNGPPPVISDHALLRCIGRGGYGEVWLARNQLGAYRAVKVVYKRSFSDDLPFKRELSGIQQFERVAHSQEGLVSVLHAGIDEHEGYFYYVMELGDDRQPGPSIDPNTYEPRTLSWDIQRQGRLCASKCVELGVALCRGLAALHDAGLLHRDIKPSNIIFVKGAPKLADIGLVTDAKEARSFVGTDGFIPPEGPTTKQADIYSLGKVLYEASTGKDRKSFPVLPTVVDQLPELDEFLELNEVIVRACEREPSLRYPTAQAMQSDLQALAQGQSLKHRRLVQKRLSWLRRIAGVCLLALLLLAVTLFGLYRERKAVAEARQRRVETSVVQGIQAMNSGDSLGALPHFTEALRLDPGDALRNRAQRLRLGSVLGRSPKLTHVWIGRAPANDGQFSPDGTKVLLARFCGNAEIYDLKTGNMRLPVLKPPPTLFRAAFSRDGHLLVTVSQNSVACIWETGNFTEVRRLPHAGLLWGARFSPDGLRLVTACSDGMARVWEIRTGLLAFALKQHTDAIQFADFSHDGRLIVTTSQDGTAQLWNAAKGEPSGAPLQHGAWVTHAAFSPDDRNLVTACLDRKARVWEIASGRKLAPEMGHSDGVESAEFSPDGRYILTASGSTARLWLAETRQPLAANPILRHPGRLTRAVFNPDGHRILTTSQDGSARVWDLAGSTANVLSTPWTFSDDGSRVVTVSNNSVHVWDSATDQGVCPPLIPTPVIERVVVGRQGRFLLTSSTLKSEPGKHLVQAWDVAAHQSFGRGLVFSNESIGVALSDQGKSVAVFDGDRVQIWDVLSGSPLSPRLSHKEAVKQCFFSHDGNRLATLSGREVRVYDARNGRAVFEPLTYSQPVQTAQFSPDDKYLIAGCSENLVTASYAQVHYAANGHPVGPRLTHAAGIRTVSFSLDSRRVVTASADFTAVVWDCATGRRVAGPLKHESQVCSATFSPDGLWIVTASADKTARVWEIRSGEPLTPAIRSLTPLTRAGFTPGQGRVFTIDDQGTAQVWPLPLEERPLENLLSLAQLIASDTPAGAVAPQIAQSESLQALWQLLRTRCPADFTVTTEQVVAWHGFQARQSELEAHWFAALFHLEHLLSLQPGDSSLGHRLAHAKACLQKGN
jgi:WD40 repeat protein